MTARADRFHWSEDHLVRESASLAARPVTVRLERFISTEEDDFVLEEPGQKFGGEFDEDKHPRDEKGRFTDAGDASRLGGAFEKRFYKENATGKMHLFKPDPPTKALAAAAHSQLARLVDPNAIPAEVMTIGGRQGLMQAMVPGATPLTGSLSKLSTADIAKLQQEHVVDWITSQHDSHPGQFIRDMNGSLLGTDKSQAWKYFPSDQLRTDYHPNAAYGERPPIYNTLFGPGGHGLSKLNPDAIRPMMEHVKAITPAQVRAILTPYAEHVFGKGPKAEAFFKAAFERVHNAPAEFSKYYSHVLKKRVKFSALVGEQFDFDESKHPRVPGGEGPDGGQFTDGASGMSDIHGEDMPAGLSDKQQEALVESHVAPEEDAPPTTEEPVLVQTGVGNPEASKTAQEQAAKDKYEKQKAAWREQGKRYRERKAAKELAAKQAALGITPTATGEKPVGYTAESLIAMATDWKTESGKESYGTSYTAMITGLQHPNPEYVKHWVALANEHGPNALHMALSQQNYASYASIKASLEAAAKADTDWILKGPKQGESIPNHDALKTAVALQYGFTPKEYTQGSAAIRSYTQNSYTKINSTLRFEGRLTLTGARMDRFMAKLPDVQADKQPELHRAFILSGSNKDGALAKALMAGKGEFKDPAFVSASTSHQFASNWKVKEEADGSSHYHSFVLTWKNEGGAKNIAPWGSYTTQEGEVIYRPGARMEILSSKFVTEKGGASGLSGTWGKWHVEVRLVPKETVDAKPQWGKAGGFVPTPKAYVPAEPKAYVAPKAEEAPKPYMHPAYTPKPVAASPAKTHIYEKKTNATTGKSYYVKKLHPEYKAWKKGH